MLRKLVLLVFVAAFVAGCGNKEAIITVAETEGVYVDVGGLTYQVQMSRFLNPGDVEDKEYLDGPARGHRRGPAGRRDLVRRVDARQELLRRAR